ncbi:unnamed protein product [Clavelina lepadiformis]|uniref:UDP-D-xylose:beta-D-glucoside alpha-1,3-D-xylosyltransferase n=1 Tax=Clavelina lepadiformis TaxID=159417 RepID=A0ABP0GRG4_CLALP
MPFRRFRFLRSLVGLFITLLLFLFIYQSINLGQDRSVRMAPLQLLPAQKISLARNVNDQKNMPSNMTVHLVVVACAGKSENILPEALTMMKSAVLFTESLLHIHVFTTNLQNKFEEEVSSWPKSVQNKFKMTVRSLQYPLEGELLEEMMNWWGPCASFRLFLPTVMADVDSVLYVDTDVIFLGAVEEIWQHFYLFNELQVGALAPRVGWDFKVNPNNPNFIEMPGGKFTQVNSGVFLMNLTRMRQVIFKTDESLSKKLSPWNKDLFIPLYRLGIKDMYGDQNLINTVFHYNPERLYYLPCKYNYHHKFCFDGYRERFCDSAEKEGAFVVHGNANTYYNNYAPAFKAANDAMRQYNFEEDIKKYLLKEMENNLRNPSVENHLHCGNKSNIFLQTLTRSINSKFSR